jgi:hypothetical protein
VLQVVSIPKTDTFTTSSTSDVAITGLSATITPTSATSKILILVNIGVSGTTGTDYGIFFSLVIKPDKFKIHKESISTKTYIPQKKI